jgi:hypothetical protein
MKPLFHLRMVIFTKFSSYFSLGPSLGCFRSQGSFFRLKDLEHIYGILRILTELLLVSSLKSLVLELLVDHSLEVLTFELELSKVTYAPRRVVEE